MPLTPEQRTSLRHRLQAEISRRGIDIGVTKADAMAAVDALDSKMDELEIQFNQALPAGPRTRWAPQLKAFVLKELIAERYIRGGG